MNAEVFNITDLHPNREEVWRLLGIPPGVEPGITVSLFGDALALFDELASPKGMLTAITGDAFAEIYTGEGRNEPLAPLAGIFPRAERLALFAVTLGEVLSHRIRELFDTREFALGTVLDAVASAGAEQAADAAENRFCQGLRAAGFTIGTGRVLRYSPGYCGWHISSQRKLLAALSAQDIGITLRESFLMEPLKSISGVLVDGPPEIHRFQAGFPFCRECQGQECRRLDC